MGQYYDVLGRDLNLSDKKIGLSKDPVSRIYQLNRTKSPIGYEVISLFKVDDMYRVEKLLHSILDSRRVHGEWFKDDEDTLTGEFVNFMNVYGGIEFSFTDIIPAIENTIDSRLVDLGSKFGEIELVRNYLGVDYDVLLKQNGMLVFNGIEYNTPNKLYNNGIVKFVKGLKGNSGTNNLSQFKVKSTGKRLVDI